MGICSSSSGGGGETASDASGAPSFDYEKQLASSTFGPYSVIVNPNEQHVGETGIHRSPATANGQLCTAVYPNEQQPVTTIWEGFQRGVRVSGREPCLGTRLYQLDVSGRPKLTDGVPDRGGYVWSSYAEVEAEAKEIGAGMVAAGLKPAESNVGIYSKNRHEYVAASLGAWSQSMRVVSLYDTFGPDSIQFIIGQAGISLIFITKENLPALLKVAANCPSLTHVVQFDDRQQWRNSHESVAKEDVDTFAGLNIRLLAYSALRSLGQSSTTVFPHPPSPSTISYIMYTSGTTGNPKGAILNHIGLCSSAAASRETVPFTPDDVHLSYLPLAHILECGIMCVMLFAGGRIGFSSGHIKKINEDLTTLRPTAMFGVPRVFQRIYQRVMAQIDDAGGITRRVAHHALSSSVAELRTGNPHFNGFLANKVFGSIRVKLGLDRCRAIVTGAAPCPPYLIEFFQVLLDCKVVQGYGMTETHCIISSTRAGDVTRGHVGGPLACCEVKLVDVPDMNYHATDSPPRGEIWVRGPQLFKGYYQEQALTDEALTADGWLRTGDVGRWNSNGSLSIIDRKKNILKLAQGEYIPVEKVESDRHYTATQPRSPAAALIVVSHRPLAVVAAARCVAGPSTASLP